jgi:4-carboxymuconolactone decarboxylase
MNSRDQVRSYFNLDRQRGVTKEELVEAITHLAFCAGGPSALPAISVAKEAFQAK